MPSGTLTYKRGEIWWVDLKPVVGSETDKERPCLILQNDIGNQNGATTIIAPLFSGTKTYPFVVNVAPTLQNGLDSDRIACRSVAKIPISELVAACLAINSPKLLVSWKQYQLY